MKPYALMGVLTTDIADGVALNNTATGYQALYHSYRGNNNTAIGGIALFNSQTGDNNTAVGYSAYISTLGLDYSNSTAVGYASAISASNIIILGNNSVSTIGGFANWTNVSDARFKTNVKERVVGLDFIMKLRPVSYNLDMDAIAKFTQIPDSLRLPESERLKAAEIQTGFLAQEVEKEAQEVGFDFYGVDDPKNEQSHYGLRYAEFVVPIVKAVQEQQEVILNQEERLAEQQKLITDLLKRVEALENKDKH